MKGALAHENPFVVCAAAQDCLRLWKCQGKGSLHTQSQRFLNSEWQGLHGDPTVDPPLRPFVEQLASGVTILDIYRSDPVSAKCLIRWLSAFKLVTRHQIHALFLILI